MSAVAKPVTRLRKAGTPPQEMTPLRSGRDDKQAPSCLGYKTPGWCKGVRS